tara:strand:+ start:40 stop:594 length:555 start_codon:yes stop_codon:yes gene_type:complete
MALYTSGVFPAGGEVGNGGGIIQTVYYYYSDVVSISGNGWNKITNWDAAITPTDSTNKILIHTWLDWSGHDDSYTIAARLYNKTGSGSYSHVSAADGAGGGNYGNQTVGVFLSGGIQKYDNYARSQSSVCYIDEPNTTSTMTYTLYVKDTRDSNDVRINRAHYYQNHPMMHYTRSGMILQELSS